MEYRTLGPTGLRVSEIGLGTMQFRWTTDEATSYAVLDAFRDAGGTFIDTADIYSHWAEGCVGGEAETIIGRWLESRACRQEIVLATKARGRMWSGPDGEGLSRAHIFRAIDDSLRRLRTDYVDLYQTHWPDDQTPLEETMTALDSLIQQGKVRHMGCSNHSATQLADAIQTSQRLGLETYATIQPHYSLVERAQFEEDVFPTVKVYGLAVIPYSPLGRGFLTGKYRRGQPPPDSLRLAGVRPYLSERNFQLLDRLEAIGRARNKTPAQVALGWLLAKEQVSTVLVGANTPDQLANSLAAAGLRLTEDEVRVLDAASA